MTTRRAVAGVVATVGVGLMAMAAAPAARAQVKLEYKYPEGQTLTYKTNMKISQVMTIQGMEIPTEVEQTIVTSRAVGKRAGDATLPIREKVDAFRTEMSLPGGMQVTYDSKQPDAKIDNPQLEFLADVFKLAGETTYTVVLDGQNKVKAIEGSEKLQEKADKLNPAVRDSMRSRFSADKLKTGFEERHANLPDVLARPGEPWERTETMNSDQELVFRKKYEYVGTEKKGDKTLDKITVKTLDMKIKVDANSQAPAKLTKSDLKVDSSEGTILFDREAGCIVESRDKVHVKGTMTLAVGEMELPGELEFTINSTQELQPGAK
jgi:hypothetical protein